MTAAVITAALFFCNITPFKNAAKDSLPCPDNTNKFILFWVKCSISFINKGINMINLPSIFRNKELTSFLPPGLKVKFPL